MNVAELIARLSAMDPALPVIMPSEDVDFCIVHQAFVDTVQINGANVQLAGERDRSWTQVVRLFGPDDD